MLLLLDLIIIDSSIMNLCYDNANELYYMPLMGIHMVKRNILLAHIVKAILKL